VALIWDVRDIPPEVRCGAVSVGNFDGVHQGHAALIARLLLHARDIAGPSVVLTFDPHPAAILRPGSEPLRLTTLERRSELLHRLGVEHVVVVSTSGGLLQQTAEEFFHDILRGTFSARAIVEGPNFYFGRGRTGTPDLLQQWSAAVGVRCEVVRPAVEGNHLISSTEIRRLLHSGEISAANRLLTAPYQLAGTVVRGDQRGRTLGFPTANLANIQTLIPGAGVYATRVHVAGRTYAGATHLGPRPTFESSSQPLVETHLIDFQGDLYDAPLAIDFLGLLRAVRRFDSATELISQMHHDIQAAARLFRYLEERPILAEDRLERAPRNEISS